jgi:hypothetical protein
LSLLHVRVSLLLELKLLLLLLTLLHLLVRHGADGRCDRRAGAGLARID